MTFFFIFLALLFIYIIIDISNINICKTPYKKDSTEAIPESNDDISEAAAYKLFLNSEISAEAWWKCKKNDSFKRGVIIEDVIPNSIKIHMEERRLSHNKAIKKFHINKNTPVEERKPINPSYDREYHLKLNKIAEEKEREKRKKRNKQLNTIPYSKDKSEYKKEVKCTTPYINHCWKCKRHIDSNINIRCSKCNGFKCSFCNTCFCN